MSNVGLTDRSQFYNACNGCQKRTEGCHGSCEEYAKEVILGALLEASERKERAKRDDEFALSAKRAWRVIKSNPRCKKYKLNNGYVRNIGR